jgi:hypothetical protein
MISQPRLEMTLLWVDLISKVLGGSALLVAAWWTYTNFTVERTHDPTMLVTISPTVHPLRDGKVLLNADVFMQNIGKVAIKPKFAEQPSQRDLGLEISIIEIEPLQPGSATFAPAAPAEAEPRVPWFDWTAGDGNPKPLLQKRNLLATNEDFRHGRYQLNPGVKYREPFACIVDKNKLYAIRARFWTDEGSVADLVYIDTFLGGEKPVAPSARQDGFGAEAAPGSATRPPFPAIAFSPGVGPGPRRVARPSMSSTVRTRGG